MSQVVNLGAARADRTRNAKNWTVVEALRQALDDVESGRLQPSMVYVAFQTADGDLRGYPFVAAGATALETMGLLAQHLHFRSAP